MADLKMMTVRALRDLARKHLGPGFSRLKTKSELVAALAAALPRALVEALEGPAARPAPAPPGPAAPERPPAPPRAGPAADRPRRPGGRGPAAPVPDTGERAPTEPDPEGHLVARVAGEKAAHDAALPLVEEKVPPSPTPPREREAYDERLGELPDGYGEDSVVLLCKDPCSAYLYWDFGRDTVERAFAWMPGLHTRVRLFTDEVLVREEDFALEARSWYFHGLSPGRTYRAELVSLSTDGQQRRIGPPSNSLRLPPDGPSGLVDDRFLRIGWDVPMPVVADALRRSPERPSAPEPPPFSEEAREALYLRSGGAARAVGSSESLAPQAAAAPPRAPAPSAGKVLGPSPSGARSSGPWPWSGTLPRR